MVTSSANVTLTRGKHPHRS